MVIMLSDKGTGAGLGLDDIQISCFLNTKKMLSCRLLLGFCCYFWFPKSVYLARRLTIISISFIGIQIVHFSSYNINFFPFKYINISSLPFHSFSASFFSMDINNLWFPPALGVIKITVHGIANEDMHPNGNLNSIGLVARDHLGNFQWGIMGPLQDMEGLQSHVWAIHTAMKLQVKKQLPRVHIESDNIADQDEDFFEEEGLTQAV